MIEEVLLIPAFPLSFSLRLIVFIYNSWTNHYPDSVSAASFLFLITIFCSFFLFFSFQHWSVLIPALQMTPQQVLWLVGISSSQSNQMLGEVSRSRSNPLMRLAHWHTWIRHTLRHTLKKKKKGVTQTHTCVRYSTGQWHTYLDSVTYTAQVPSYYTKKAFTKGHKGISPKKDTK